MSKLIFELEYRRVIVQYSCILKGKLWNRKGNKFLGRCSRAMNVPCDGNTGSEEPKIQRIQKGLIYDRDTEGLKEMYT